MPRRQFTGLQGEKAGVRRSGELANLLIWPGFRKLFNKINDLAGLQTIICRLERPFNLPNQGFRALRAARPADLVLKRGVHNIRDRGPGEPPNEIHSAARGFVHNFSGKLAPAPNCFSENFVIPPINYRKETRL